MKRFEKKVDMRSRKAMTEFLAGHERYNTMNSWNRSTSYANCIKVDRLDLPPDVRESMYDMLEFFDMSDILNEYGEDNGYNLQAGVNGRSGGYIVMYRGYRRPGQHKSVCTACGQRNFKTVEESGNNRCGRCGEDRRINHAFADIGVYPGRSIDQGEDFSAEEWSMDALRERVRMVRSFDRMCDLVVEAFIDFCRNHRLEEREVVYTRTESVAVPIGED